MEATFKTRLTSAAQLRAQAYDWDMISAVTQREPSDCDKWPDRYREVWDVLYTDEQFRRYDQANNEARECLRRLLQDDKPTIRLKAAEILLRVGKEYRPKRPKLSTVEIPEIEEGKPCPTLKPETTQEVPPLPDLAANMNEMRAKMERVIQNYHEDMEFQREMQRREKVKEYAVGDFPDKAPYGLPEEMPPDSPFRNMKAVVPIIGFILLLFYGMYSSMDRNTLIDSLAGLQTKIEPQKERLFVVHSESYLKDEIESERTKTVQMPSKVPPQSGQKHLQLQQMPSKHVVWRDKTVQNAELLRLIT